VNRWTRAAIFIYFVFQSAFQTFLSAQVTEETRWNLWFVFLGMAAVVLFDEVANRFRRATRGAPID
jgi:hypothetical protein